jgi:hypothetical protein
MIELRTLTRKDRTLISAQCERFFLVINKYKDAQPVFNVLKESLGLPDRYDPEIWCVITCVGKSLRTGVNGSQFSLKSANFTTANKIHNLKLNQKRASEVIRRLDEQGWLVYYKGYKNLKVEDDLMRSCIIFSKKLTSLFSIRLIARYAEKISQTEMVEVRDSKTKLPFMKLTRFKNVNSRRNSMYDYNKVLHEGDITLGGFNCAVTYKQVFSDDLDGAGRLYTFGGFQTAHGDLRSLIKIKGNIVTEVDIKGIHPSICRLLQGCPKVDESFDPYGIGSEFKSDWSVIELRSICKAAMMCMINCKRKKGASEALYNIWAKDCNRLDDDRWFPSIKYFDIDLAETLITYLEEHNSPVVFFGKGSLDWKQLQRCDSRVCEGVVARFTQKGIPVLCWHDSWVCEVQHRDFLIQCIKDSWFEVFNTKDNCFLKVEF